MIKGLGNINFSAGQIYLGIYLILESVWLQAVKMDKLRFCVMWLRALEKEF